VEGLVASGVKTHYFLRGDRYWSNVLDETESRIVEERLKEEGPRGAHREGHGRIRADADRRYRIHGR